MSLRVAVCTEEDLARLLVGETSRHTAHDHRERFALQAAGRCAYLLAWDGVLNVGRATLLVASKYAPVRERFPGYAEVNALATFPQGRGTGTALLRRAEELAAARGHDDIGLAVDPDDPGPRRLHGSPETPAGRGKSGPRGPERVPRETSLSPRSRPLFRPPCRVRRTT